jgi:hypothetical protein
MLLVPAGGGMLKRRGAGVEGDLAGPAEVDWNASRR